MRSSTATDRPKGTDAASDRDRHRRGIDRPDRSARGRGFAPASDCDGRSVRVRLDSEPTHRHGVVVAPVRGRRRGASSAASGCGSPSTRPPTRPSRPARVTPSTGHVPFWEPAKARAITLDVPGTTVMGPGVHVTAWGASAPLHPRASQPPGLLRELDARFGVHPGFGQEYDCGWHDPRAARSPHRRARDRRAASRRHRRRADGSRRLGPDADRDVGVAFGFRDHVARGRRRAPARPLRCRRTHAARRGSSGRSTTRSAPSSTTHRDDAAIVVFSLDGMRTNDGDLPSIDPPARADASPALRQRDGARRRHRSVASCRLPAAHPTAGSPLAPRHRRAPHRAAPPTVDPRRARLPSRPAHHARSSRARAHQGRDARCAGGADPSGIVRRTPGARRPRESVDSVQFIDNYRPYRPAMRAFALPTFADSYVRINLAGRDAHGIVPIDEFEAELRAVEHMIRGVPGRPHRCSRSPTASNGSTRMIPSARRPIATATSTSNGVAPTDAIEHPDVGAIGPFPFNRTGAHHELGFAWLSGVRAGARDPRTALRSRTSRRRSCGCSTTTRRSRRPVADPAGRDADDVLTGAANDASATRVRSCRPARRRLLLHEGAQQRDALLLEMGRAHDAGHARSPHGRRRGWRRRAVAVLRCRAAATPAAAWRRGAGVVSASSGNGAGAARAQRLLPRAARKAGRERSNWCSARSDRSKMPVSPARAQRSPNAWSSRCQTSASADASGTRSALARESDRLPAQRSPRIRAGSRRSPRRPPGSRCRRRVPSPTCRRQSSLTGMKPTTIRSPRRGGGHVRRPGRPSGGRRRPGTPAPVPWSPRPLAGGPNSRRARAHRRS